MMKIIQASSRERFARLVMILCVGALACALPGSAGDTPNIPGPANVEPAVRPVQWDRFNARLKPDPDLEQCGRLLVNAARYCNGLLPATYQEDAARKLYRVPNKNNEYVIRGPAGAACGWAVVLKTGLFDEKLFGVSRAELTRRTTWLIKGIAAVHKANPGGKWGDHWQSAMWAEHVGSAAWLMWDELDEEARAMIVRMVIHEADRFIQPGYQVPYWNGQGGDTKAEENAWNSMILQLAVAMLPGHPHVARWKAIGSELMIGAYSRQSDMARTDLTIDGRTPREWLKGYNIREDGTLYNHNIIHNDYMATIAITNMRAFTLCSLAGIPAPEACDFNFDLLYKAFQTVRFPSPPYKAPGGTMYVPGQVEQYYPQGTDWSTVRHEIFYITDVQAHLLGADRDLPSKALPWMRLRAQRMLAMQGRHADGHMFEKGEFTAGALSIVEQVELYVFSHAYLFQWLNAQGALGQQANWLK